VPCMNGLIRFIYHNIRKFGDVLVLHFSLKVYFTCFSCSDSSWFSDVH
jgi:hypothetical protein